MGQQTEWSISADRKSVIQALRRVQDRCLLYRARCLSTPFSSLHHSPHHTPHPVVSLGRSPRVNNGRS